MKPKFTVNFSQFKKINMPIEYSHNESTGSKANLFLLHAQKHKNLMKLKSFQWIEVSFKSTKSKEKERENDVVQ